ncbi:MAG: GFA family protein [Pseudomonadota bacterium]
MTGRCYCGAVSLTTTVRPQSVAYCHCIDCRRVTGAPVAAFAAFPEGSVSLTTDHVARFSAPGIERQFCAVCGSAMTARFGYIPGQIYLPVGVLDDAESLEPAVHAHADAALPWLCIHDDLPRERGSARETLKAAP